MIFNLTDPAFVADPYPFYDKLRKTAPVVRLAPDQPWLVTSYELVRQGLSDPRLSSGARRFSRGFEILPDAEQDKFRPFLEFISKVMVFQDGDRHHLLRRLIGRAFSAEALSRYQPTVEGVVAELLSPASRDMATGRPIDLIASFARPLPIRIIGDILGVPHQDQTELASAADSLATFFGSAHPSREECVHVATQTEWMRCYFIDLATRRARDPGNDLLSRLIGIDNEQLLETDDLAAQCVMLLFGGLETTRNLIGNAVLALLTHKGQWAELVAKPDLAAKAVEEVLRYDTSGQFVSRMAAETLDFGPGEVKRGDAVLLILGAANRDPARFKEPGPNTFCITRRDPGHLSFGAGPHVCIGAGLARLLGRVALTQLAIKYPDLALTQEPTLRTSNINFRGPTELKIVREQTRY